MRTSKTWVLSKRRTGRIVFDMNDFDETIAETFATSYFQTMRQMGQEPILTAARHQIHRLKKVQAVSAALQQAGRAQPFDLLKKYTEPSRSDVRFREVPSVLWRIEGQKRQEILKSLPVYRALLAPDRLHLFTFFRPLDVAFKIVGTGSVALRDYVVLMEGNGPGDPLFLQIKQEVNSAYTRYLLAQPWAHQGQRVVDGQRRVQPISDLLLGWTRIGQGDFLVRQLNDHKGSVDLSRLQGAGLATLAALAGELLARGHARSRDALAIASYAGSGDKIIRAITHYGRIYAEWTTEDFHAFKGAVANGRFKAVA